MRKTNYFTPSELAMFETQNPIFNKEQMKFINRKTPASELEIKEDKEGHNYKSVKAAYIKALVTLVTGGNYSFEIKNKEYIRATNEVIVEASLSITCGGHTVTREQIGQHHLNLKTTIKAGSTNQITHASDIGNGYKAAASDAFKKCASEFGFCWDVYGQEHADKKKEEQPIINHAEKTILKRLEHFLKEAKTFSEIQEVYNTFITTNEETEASKNLLKEAIKPFAKILE